MSPPRSSMSMRSLTRIAALAGREIAAKRGLVSSRSRLKLTGDSGSKAARVLQDHFDHALDQSGLDGGVGPAFDAHRRSGRAGRRAARRRWNRSGWNRP